MPSRVLTISATDPDPAAVGEAAACLRRDGVIGLPTETVYGIAASLVSDQGIRRVRELKQRPAAEPLPVQVASADEAARLVGAVPVRARPLMKHFWPGPLTIVFREALVSAGGQGIGIRVPAHPVAQAVLRRVEGPLVVPSCNPRHAAPAVSAAEVLDYFPEGLDLLLDGGETQIREASTVVRVDGESWELLRGGLISREMLARLIEGRTYLFVCTGNTCRSPMAHVLAEESFRRHVGLSRDEVRALGFRFLSAGTAAQPGRPASPRAVDVITESGLSLHGHRTRGLTPSLIRRADAIYCMDSEHRRHLVDLAPAAAGKIRILAPGGVPDPAGGDIAEYREVRERIREAIEGLWR